MDLKRVAAVLLLMTILLAGCAGKDGQLQRGLALRERLSKQDCSFTTQITAAYGELTYTFTVFCTADTKGNLRFSVVTPESIAGISGTLDGSGGRLTFDDKALAFSMLADGEVSPVSAPWLLMKTLRSGYIRSCCEEESGLRLSVDDSYEDNPLRLDIWLGKGDVPIFAEVLWQGRRVLSMQIDNFTFV